MIHGTYLLRDGRYYCLIQYNLTEDHTHFLFVFGSQHKFISCWCFFLQLKYIQKHNLGGLKNRK